MTIRYDEIQEGDIILFHGARERVIKVVTFPAPANDYFPEEKTISFDLEPADDKAISLLGNFYSHGTYGGVGCLRTELLERGGKTVEVLQTHER